MIEQQFYNLSLLLAGIVNLMMAAVLLYNNFYYRDYVVYFRSRQLTALSLAVFGAGFLLHLHFGWRASWPIAASALSVSYFHIGGLLLSWSHTSLLNPQYLRHFVIVRDAIALFIGITVLWVGAFMHSFLILNIGVGVFLVHVAWMSVDFLNTNYRVRRQFKRLPVTEMNARWWSSTVKQSVFWGQRSMSIACYMIILWGLGSIILTALIPYSVWPYTVLLCMGCCVFGYIFYTLDNYGMVIEAATNATEDVTLLTESSLSDYNRNKTCQIK